MPISQMQTKYAVERISQIVIAQNRRIDAEEKAERREELTADAKCKLIREGKAKMVSTRIAVTGARYNGVPDVTECFDYPEAPEIERHNKKVHARAEQRRQSLQTEATRLRDKLMLGDAQEALNLLAEFSEKEF